MTVFITAQGDRHHSRSDCRQITAGHNAAVTNGGKVNDPEPVSLAEAAERGKAKPCSFCG